MTEEGVCRGRGSCPPGRNWSRVLRILEQYPSQIIYVQLLNLCHVAMLDQSLMFYVSTEYFLGCLNISLLFCSLFLVENTIHSGAFPTKISTCAVSTDLKTRALNFW